MSTAVENLNVLIGGRLDPSLQAMMNRLGGVLDRLERRIRGGTNAFNQNTAAMRNNTSGLNTSATAAERYARAREREANAARRSTMEHSKLAGVFRNLKGFANSKEFQALQFKGGVAAIGGGAALQGVGMASSRGDAAKFDDLLTQAAIIQGKSLDVLPELKSLFMDASGRRVTNQDAVVLAGAFREALTSGVLDWEQSKVATVASGRWATAVKADTGDIMNASVSGLSKFGVKASDLNRYHAALATAGDMGSFEYRDMAKWLPQLGTHAQKLRLNDVAGASRMAAMLQGVRTATGSSDTAGNNLFNLFEKMTSKEAMAGLAKEGINLRSLEMQADRYNKDPENQKAGRTTDIVTLMLDRLRKKYKGKSDVQIAASLNEFFGDMQARQAIAALVTKRDLVDKIDAEARKKSGTEESSQAVLKDKYDKQVSSLEESWKSIQQSISNVGSAFGDSMKPLVQNIATIVDYGSRFLVGLMRWSPTLTSFVAPTLMVGGAIAAATAKLRLLGRFLNLFGSGSALNPLAQRLMRLPSLTTMIRSSFSWMWSGISRGAVGVVTRLQNLRFIAASMHLAIRAGMRNLWARMIPNLSGIWARIMQGGGSVLARVGPMFSGLWTRLLSAGGGMLSRLGPFAMRAGGVLVRGLGFVFTRGVAALLGTVGAVIMAAVGGWQIGKWINEAFGVDEMIAGWYAKITGMQKRMEEMSKPIATAEMNVGRLAMLEGPQANAAREKAIQGWQAKAEEAKAKLKAKEGEWWTSDADAQDMERYRQEIKLAEQSQQNLRTQIARASAGKTVFGEGPAAIRAAEMQLAQMQRIAEGGKDVGDIKASDAVAYAAGLRNQLAEMKAKAATLNGQAASSTHTTQVNMNVTGLEGKEAAKAVADQVAKTLEERDRAQARAYRGAASTGNLGE